jgi:ABC-type multidrug transport system fused ATPase/permease subunit
MLMSSVDRIEEYSNLKREGLPLKSLEEKESLNEISQGKIEFSGVTAFYGENDEKPIVSDLTFTIDHGQKIGICGRTGSGKSTLINLIFRIIECSKGSIYIDNIDIAKLNSTSLISKLSIIPQEPVLFSKTVRWNLDPFDEFSDNEIWNALEIVKMKSLINELPDKLHYKVSEGGRNFSVGQRQLICFARAILKKPSILICDEATASIDSETDEMIQKMIRKYFNRSTILTIAHRIETISDYDKILCLDKGRVAEFDNPSHLLSNPNSLFYKMCNEKKKGKARKLN